MKKNIYRLITLFLGVLGLAMIFINGFGWAQEIDNDSQVPTWSNTDSIQENNKDAVPWNTSAPIPEGVQILSPPDRPFRIDPLDSEDRAGYNASLRIAGSILTPRESNVEWSVGGEGGCLYATTGDRYTWFNTPLYLEQGSTIAYFRMYYDDQNVSSNSSAYLTIYDLYGHIVDEFGVFSSGTGQNYATTAEIGHIVDYTSYSYVINWSPNSLGSDQQVCGFRIFYQTPLLSTYLPLIEQE